MVENPRTASVIFITGERGQVDEPALTAAEQANFQRAAQLTSAAMVTVPPTPEPAKTALDERRLASQAAAQYRDQLTSDQSSAFPVFMFVMMACLWLLLGSTAGLIASVKLHESDWQVAQAWLSFGRVRSVHLNAVIYGWATNGGLPVIVWLLPRLLRIRLAGPHGVTLGGALLNEGLAAGVCALALGGSDGMEYLGIPWQIDLLILAGLAIIVLSVLYTPSQRKAARAVL